MDRRSIEELHIPGRVLMELAGAGSARVILDRVPRAQGRAVILCGPGGNGGDGYVVARHLHDQGWTVRCLSVVPPETLQGESRENQELWAALGGETLSVGDAPTARMRHHLGHANVIVDALYGTGQRQVTAPGTLQLMEWSNEATHGQRVALDVPTGVAADSGVAPGAVFNAHFTTTYGLAKPGLYQEAGLLHAGEVIVLPIGLPAEVVDAVGASVRRVTRSFVTALIPERARDGHKGTFGHVGVVGGALGMEGASLLAARGALRSGVGLVTWNMPSGVQRDLEFPEVMTHDASCGLDTRSGTLVVGPGLGTSADGARLLELALESGRPLILDADALTLLAQLELKAPPGSILTPHPGEAATLLGTTVQEVQSDRLAATRHLSDAYGATVALKGAGTVITSPGEPICLVDIACPALAIPGSGDVLAGIIAGLRSQGLNASSAAQVGVWLHGRAGVTLGQASANRGVLASEIADRLPATISDVLSGR